MMKSILFVLFMLISFAVEAQVPKNRRIPDATARNRNNYYLAVFKASATKAKAEKTKVDKARALKVQAEKVYNAKVKKS